MAVLGHHLRLLVGHGRQPRVLRLLHGAPAQRRAVRQRQAVGLGLRTLDDVGAAQVEDVRLGDVQAVDVHFEGPLDGEAEGEAEQVLAVLKEHEPVEVGVDGVVRLGPGPVQHVLVAEVGAVVRRQPELEVHLAVLRVEHARKLGLRRLVHAQDVEALPDVEMFLVGLDGDGLLQQLPLRLVREVGPDQLVRVRQEVELIDAVLGGALRDLFVSNVHVLYFRGSFFLLNDQNLVS